MKNFILKTNKWYDNLPEPKRSLFFLIVIMGSLIAVQYLTYAKNYIWAFPLWATIICSWRCIYMFKK